MKNSVKCCFLLVGFWVQGLSVAAQNISIGDSRISVHAGPARYIGKLIGITDSSSSYGDGLRNGVAWSADYFFTGIGHSSCRFAPGLMYQGSQYKNAHEEGSDRIQMHYIAPQLSFYYVRPDYTVSLGTGVGYQYYKDHSTVFEKPREVSMSKLAFNLSAGGEYLFASHIGVSARLNWIISSSESYSVRYHGRDWQVEAPRLSDGGGFFSQLALLFGLNFHF